jgi:hypothetical protein
MTTFNIGTQNAASINNVGGDMVIEGGLHASAQWSYELRNELVRASEELARLPIPRTVRAKADDALLSAAAEAGNGKPDKRRIAELLGRSISALKEAGALAAAGTSLLDSLRRAGSLLGPVGATVLALL